MQFIKQNATHKVVIGPFVAVGDGFTPVTNFLDGSADEAEAILHDNATVVDISGYTLAAITTADGYYHLTLQTGITSTVGHLTVIYNDDSLILPVKADFTVIEEAVYDIMYASDATGPSQITTTQVNTECDTALTDYDGPTNAEMVARTLLTASYFDPAADAVANVTLVATTTTNTDMVGTDSAALASVCTETRLAELDAANLPTDIADIPTVAEFNARTLVSANYFDPTSDAVANVTLVATTTTNTDVTALNDISTAQVNAEVLDVMSTDTFAEPGTGAPPATASMEEKISWIYATFRNKKTQTATLWTLRNDADSADICKSTVSDAASTFTKEEIVTG